MFAGSCSDLQGNNQLLTFFGTIVDNKTMGWTNYRSKDSLRCISSLGALGEGPGWDLRIRPAAPAPAAPPGNLGTWKSGGLEIWGPGNLGIWRSGDLEIQKFGAQQIPKIKILKIQIRSS